MIDLPAPLSRRPLQDCHARCCNMAKGAGRQSAKPPHRIGNVGCAVSLRKPCRTAINVLQIGGTGSLSSMSVIKSLFKESHQEVSSTGSVHGTPARENTP